MKTLHSPFSFFNFSIQLFQLRDAVRADVFAAIADDLLRALAENAGGLILAKNNAVPFHIDFKRVLLADVERTAHLDRENDTAQFIDSAYDTGGFQINSFLSSPAFVRAKEGIEKLHLMEKVPKMLNIYNIL